MSVRVSGTMILAAGLIIVALYTAIGLFVGYRAARASPVNPPRYFIKGGRRPGTRKVIVVAGDSLTQGTFGVDYVGLLRAQRPADEFVNAGVNGDTSADLLARVGDIAVCGPDAVIILIGTNDIQRLSKAGRLGERAALAKSVEAYSRNLREMIDILQAKTQARIAILSIPPIGEDFGSASNSAVREFNEAIQELSRSLHVAYIPAYEAFSDAIHDAQRVGPYTADPPSPGLSARTALRHFLLYQSWDHIGRIHGYELHIDGIHLNTRGAAILVGLIEKWLALEERVVPLRPTPRSASGLSSVR